jgi:hypothetical protein
MVRAVNLMEVPGYLQGDFLRDLDDPLLNFMLGRSDGRRPRHVEIQTSRMEIPTEHVTFGGTTSLHEMFLDKVCKDLVAAVVKFGNLIPISSFPLTGYGYGFDVGGKNYIFASSLAWVRILKDDHPLSSTLPEPLESRGTWYGIPIEVSRLLEGGKNVLVLPDRFRMFSGTVQVDERPRRLQEKAGLAVKDLRSLSEAEDLVGRYRAGQRDSGFLEELLRIHRRYFSKEYPSVFVTSYDYALYREVRYA